MSPLYVALAAKDRGGPGADAFLEELIIRRELSLNYVHYNPAYDSLAGLPQWARNTLEAHAGDRRPYLYDLATLERAATHDPYWNAAQTEMLRSGSMHNYMRMYWGKKILEWSPTPATAFAHALHLNNRWQLDGRDPNSYAGVAWCFGMHDRPWRERPIFGKARYMNAAGLDASSHTDYATFRRKAGVEEPPKSQNHSAIPALRAGPYIICGVRPGSHSQPLSPSLPAASPDADGGFTVRRGPWTRAAAAATCPPRRQPSSADTSTESP
jgi:hypothetical protein